MATQVQVIQALSTEGSDKALRMGILPRGLGRGEDFLDAHAFDSSMEYFTVDAVTVADHVLGRRVLGKCLDDLLSSPDRTWEFGDVEVKDTPTVVREDEEDIQNAEGCRGHGEEVDGGQGADMVVEESAPGLGGRLAWFGRHESRDASLADVDAELEQFAMDSWSAPQRIGLGHLPDELLHRRGDAVIGGPA